MLIFWTIYLPSKHRQRIRNKPNFRKKNQKIKWTISIVCLWNPKKSMIRTIKNWKMREHFLHMFLNKKGLLKLGWIDHLKNNKKKKIFRWQSLKLLQSICPILLILLRNKNLSQRKNQKEMFKGLRHQKLRQKRKRLKERKKELILNP